MHAKAPASAGKVCTQVPSATWSVPHGIRLLSHHLVGLLYRKLVTSVEAIGAGEKSPAFSFCYNQPMYKDRLHSVLSPAEHTVFKKLNTPNKIQDYLDALPQNFSYSRGRVLRSPRRVIAEGKAYCFEGAVFAAASLAYHGGEPLIMDLRTIKGDVDHVVAPFKQNGLWGAISKTNYSVLKWRDPVYKSPRELAMSYFHEYFLDNGTKSFKDYSLPFNLKKFKLEDWLITKEPLEDLAVALDDAPHFPTAPLSILKKTRRASDTEIAASDTRDWKGEERVSHEV